MKHAQLPYLIEHVLKLFSQIEVSLTRNDYSLWLTTRCNWRATYSELLHLLILLGLWLWQVRFLSVQCNFHLVVFGRVSIILRSLCMVEKYRLRPCFIDKNKKISFNGQHDIVWIHIYSAGTKSHPFFIFIVASCILFHYVKKPTNAHILYIL
jgi:hypothetical protein